MQTLMRCSYHNWPVRARAHSGGGWRREKGKSRQKVVGNLNGRLADIYTPSVSRIVGRYVEAVAGMESIVPTWLSVFHAWQDRARG